MKNIKKMWKDLDKKKATIFIAVTSIIILLVLLLVFNEGSSRTKLVCTRKQENVSGIVLEDEVILKLRRNKIFYIEGEKAVTLSDEYMRFDTYKKIIKNSLTKTYNYINKDNLNVEVKDNVIKVEYSTKDNGVILDNFWVEQLNKNNKFDISFRTQSNFADSSSSYKIGDEYKMSQLKKKVEELGYVCK